jgi:mRNA-degrading endonuclease RelE of RelBE toxin-antitoxin system
MSDAESDMIKRGTVMAADESGVAAVVDDAPTCPHEVIELNSFSSDADKLLSKDELDALRVELAQLRQLGDVIRDSGGLRKFRWGAKGKGKRGGARVIYYYGGDHMPIFLIAIYAKNEKSDMTGAEKKAAKKFVEALRQEYATRLNAPPKSRFVKNKRKGS